MLEITVGDVVLGARLEEERAPTTLAVVRRLLPFEGRLAHVKWSGNALWVGLGDSPLELPAENATSYPRVGELLLYPGGTVDAELLVPYGPSVFSSNVGLLAGNHFATIVGQLDALEGLGARCLWQGAYPIRIDEV